MKINKKNQHENVSCLPKELELAIMKEVKKEVSSLLLSDSEKKKAIENANNSKVCDLEDTIKIEYV